MIEIPLKVGPHEAGRRLDVFVSMRMARMSRQLVQAVVRTGQIRCDEQVGPFRPAQRVRLGQVWYLKRPRLDEADPDSFDIPILYEDAHLMAVNKPGNLVVHPTASAYHASVIRIMRARTGLSQLDLAHRIDKETSGLLLLAKNTSVASALKEAFAKRRMQKAYLALVVHVPLRPQFVVDAAMRLAPASETGVLMEISKTDGYPAETAFRCLAAGRQLALVAAEPRTGRQHQIRLHAAHAGHPLLGDKLYFGGEHIFIEAIRGALSDEALTGAVGHQRQALHAYELVFDHPVTGEAMRLRAPLAPDLAALAQRFGVDAARFAGGEGPPPDVLFG